MRGVDPNRHRPSRTISEYTQYCWQTGQSRDMTIFKASVKAVVGNIVAVELHTGQYLTGAAHGIPATQYLNWQRDQSRVLALDAALQPGAHPAFAAALRRAHTAWLASNPDARPDPPAYAPTRPLPARENLPSTHGGRERVTEGNREVGEEEQG